MTTRHSTLSLQLRCNDRAPGATREAMRALDGIGWILGDAMLVASELVTNAVLHSGCIEQDTIFVALEVGGDHLTISVTDPGTSGGRAAPVDDEAAFGGMGLRIVQQAARRWGTERDGGHHVWAELALPSAAEAARQPGSPAEPSRSTPV